jgi:hypothetical protein
MVEIYEENIEDWYMNHKNTISLTEFLCEKVILKNDDKCKYFKFNILSLLFDRLLIQLF